MAVQDDPGDAQQRRRLDGLAAGLLPDEPRVVVVGAGFGGIEVARRLQRSRIRLIVIDRHNYTLFQPLLYQVATAALSPADVAVPIRALLKRPNTRAVQRSCLGLGESKMPHAHRNRSRVAA